MATLKPRTLLQFLIDTQPSAYTVEQLKTLFPEYPNIEQRLNCFVGMGIVGRFESFTPNNTMLPHYHYLSPTKD